MALPPLASTDDLDARLPAGLADADPDAAAAALDDASAIVRDEAGKTWLDEDGELTDVPAMVVAITCACAIRALNRSLIYGADGQAQDSSGLYLKKDEKRRLHGGAVLSSVRLTAPSAVTSRVVSQQWDDDE